MSPNSEFIEHLKVGVTGCLVCGKKPLLVSYTDLHGEVKCEICGATYQSRNYALKPEWMESNEVTRDMIKTPYCNRLELLDLMRDYWNETHEYMPFGSWIGGGDERIGLAWDKLGSWLKSNADKYKERYADNFNWELLLAVDSNSY